MYNSSGTLLLTITNPNPGVDDNFGFSVAGVGSDILVGAPNDDTSGSNTGAVYLFDGSTGALLETFTNPTAAIDDLFGWSVGGVGSTGVLIGAKQDNTGAANTGAAYLFVPEDTLTGSNVLFPFGGGLTTDGGGTVEFNSVTVDGETTASLATPNSNILADGGYHMVTFVSGDGAAEEELFYSFSTTATHDGNLELTIKFDPTRIPFALDTSHLRGIHDHSDGTFHVIVPDSVDNVNNTATISHDGGFSGYGLAVQPEPSTILMLLLPLGGLVSRWLYRRR